MTTQAKSNLTDLDHATRIIIPKRAKGRQSVHEGERYEAELAAFCAAIVHIRSTINFDVSSRGWCYLLENHGVTDGDFAAVQGLINDCRKSGALPLDICCPDERRSADGLEVIHDGDPVKYAYTLVEGLRSANGMYIPFSFWDEQDCYVEMVVEKIDLKNLFAPVCAEYCIPIANNVGRGDLNQRYAMMQRFAHWETRGKQCVLLYCGDHDPAGLNISRFLQSNLEELEDAAGWSPDGLIIDRFGLNYDFIMEHGLSWIDNLETGSKRRLDDPRHPSHNLPYVQNYLRKYGARKVEANALVIREQAAHDLCRTAINQYVDEAGPKEYRNDLEPKRRELRRIIDTILGDG